MTIADRLFTNARFHTLDPDNPNAEALASWRGRIIGVGGPGRPGGTHRSGSAIHAPTCPSM